MDNSQLDQLKRIIRADIRHCMLHKVDNQVIKEKKEMLQRVQFEIDNRKKTTTFYSRSYFSSAQIS